MKQIDDELFNQEDDQAPVKEDWKIKDVGSADWALSKIKAIEANYQNQINYLDSFISKAKAMKENIESKMISETEFLAERLKEWTKETIKNQKSKTINLLNGSLSIRKTPEKVDIFDEEKAFTFCFDKNINMKFNINIDCSKDEVAEIMELTEKFHKRMHFDISPTKTNIAEYFKLKKVDSADFPGGAFKANGESFSIK